MKRLRILRPIKPPTVERGTAIIITNDRIKLSKSIAKLKKTKIKAIAIVNDIESKVCDNLSAVPDKFIVIPFSKASLFKSLTIALSSILIATSNGICEGGLICKLTVLLKSI